MLRKEPAARYASIEAVRADVYAYQHNLPVAAHNAAFSYRTGKYLRRNWRTIALVAVATISLAVYAASMKMQNTRVQVALAKAQVEQRKAEQVAQFLSQTFEAADPNKGGLKGITAYDLLENARTKINEDLKDLPDVQAPLLNIFSKIYFRQQDYAKAEILLANLLNNPKAVEQLDKQLLAETQVRLAQQKIGQGQLSEAEKLLRSSLEIQKNTVALKQPGNPLYGEALTLLGHCLYNQKRREEADELTRQAINYLKNLGEAGDRVRAIALNSLANSQFMYDDLDGAIENMREALVLRKKVLGDDHTETSNFQLFLARMLLDREEYDEAEALVKSAHTNLTNKLPSAHPYFSVVAGTLARLAQRRGQIDESERIIVEQLKGIEIEKLSSSQGNLYMYLLDILLDQDKAQSVLKEVSRLTQLPLFKSESSQSRLALSEGRAYLLLNKPEQALNSFDAALEIVNERTSEANIIRRERALAFFLLGNNDEANIALMPFKNRLVNQQISSESLRIFVCRLFYLIGADLKDHKVGPPCTQSIKDTRHVYMPLHIKRWL
jgi:eukaryotic-like serine/threonine-protein kinase